MSVEWIVAPSSLDRWNQERSGCIIPMELIAVAAVSENNVIGKDGELPWPSVPADKRQYRERVRNSPVVLGRRTFESMRDELPGARQLVLSRSRDAYPESTVTVLGSVEAVLAEVESEPTQVYVLGGGGIYEALFPHLDRLLISRIPRTVEGDTMFPEIDPAEWDRQRASPRDGFVLEEWVRRFPAHAHDGP